MQSVFSISSHLYWAPSFLSNSPISTEWAPPTPNAVNEIMKYHQPPINLSEKDNYRLLGFVRTLSLFWYLGFSLFSHIFIINLLKTLPRIPSKVLGKPPQPAFTCFESTMKTSMCEICVKYLKYAWRPMCETYSKSTREAPEQCE